MTPEIKGTMENNKHIQWAIVFRILLLGIIFLVGCSTFAKQQSMQDILTTTQNPAFDKLLQEIDRILLEQGANEKPYFFAITFKEVDSERLISIFDNFQRPWILDIDNAPKYFIYNNAHMFFISDDDNKMQIYYLQGIELNKDVTQFLEIPEELGTTPDNDYDTLFRFYKVDDNDNLIRLEWSKELVLRMREN